MTAVPSIPARTLVQALRALGFEEVRIRGSHHRFAHRDGRKTTVPIHSGRDIPRGLLRKIVVQDLEMTMEDFLEIL